METGTLRLTLIVPNFEWCDWDENTRWRFIPYNLCLLAAVLYNDADISIIDANESSLTSEDFTKKLSELCPDIVGITVLMDQYSKAGHHAAKLVKEFNSEIKTIMGGVYATMNPEKALHDTNIDFVVIGEGEFVLRELIKFIQYGGQFPERGVAYRKNGEIINTGHAAFINDLDTLPLPAYNLIDFHSYTSKLPRRKSVDMPSQLPYARILTSRGCPYGCVFCQVESISGKKFRVKSPDTILDEIQWMKNEYNIQSLIFDDDNLYTDIFRANKIFKGLIERDLIMPWVSISTAVFRLNEELIELMRKSGCEYINIAIESGNKRVLNEIIKKPVNFEHAKKMVKIARKAGIFVAANFIIGFPTEKWDEIRETVSFAEKINVDYVKIFAAMPLPQTRLWDLCKKENAFKKDYDSNNLRWSNGQIETKDFSARDLTILRAYEWDRINFSSPEKRNRIAQRMKISDEELLAIRRRTLETARNYVEE